MNTQPDALRLADELEMWTMGEPAAVELRRLHAENVELREAIKRAVQAVKIEQAQPVAWVCYGSATNGKHAIDYDQTDIDDIPVGTMLYTAPPQRQPLTDEEIIGLWDGHTVPVFGKTGINPIVFARAIEAAHGIKGKA